MLLTYPTERDHARSPRKEEGERIGGGSFLFEIPAPGWDISRVIQIRMKLFRNEPPQTPAMREAAARVFVYGSLMSRPVLLALLGRVPRADPAVLCGFERRRVAGEVFPALVARASAPRLRGLVFSELSLAERRIFDEFEDDAYQKQTVRVVVAGVDGDPFGWAMREDEPDEALRSSTAELDAEAYVWADAATGLDAGAWSARRDFLPHEAGYVRMCEEFARSPEVAALRSGGAG